MHGASLLPDNKNLILECSSPPLTLPIQGVLLKTYIAIVDSKLRSHVDYSTFDFDYNFMIQELPRLKRLLVSSVASPKLQQWQEGLFDLVITHGILRIP